MFYLYLYSNDYCIYSHEAATRTAPRAAAATQAPARPSRDAVRMGWSETAPTHDRTRATEGGDESAKMRKAESEGRRGEGGNS